MWRRRNPSSHLTASVSGCSGKFGIGLGVRSEAIRLSGHPQSYPRVARQKIQPEQLGKAGKKLAHCIEEGVGGKIHQE